MNIIAGNINEDTNGKMSQGDLDNPFAFFRNFFIDNEFIDYRNKFFAGYSLCISYPWDPFFRAKSNPQSISEYYALAVLGTEDQDNEMQEEHFKNQLQDRMQFHENESFEIIRNKIASLPRSNEIETYLKKQIVELKLIASVINGNPEITKYPENLHVIKRLYDNLITTYAPFLNGTIPSFDQFSNEPKETEAPSLTMAQSPENDSEIAQESYNAFSSIKGFKWVANPFENTFLLYQFFTENSTISKVSTGEKFKTAFSGEIIESPLAIKWLFKTRGGRIKPAILRVIELLTYELKVLEDIPVQSHRAKTIEAIFCDPVGNPIKNTEESISIRKKSKGIIKDMVLDNLINDLRKVPFSVTPAKNH